MRQIVCPLTGAVTFVFLCERAWVFCLLFLWCFFPLLFPPFFLSFFLSLPRLSLSLLAVRRARCDRVELLFSSCEIGWVLTVENDLGKQGVKRGIQFGDSFDLAVVIRGIPHCT